MRRLLPLLVLLCVAILGGAAALPLLRPKPASTPVHQVARGEFVRQVSAEGHLEAVQSVPISLPADVREMMKVAWIAEDQVPVRRGDALVRFDPTDFEQMLRRGQKDRVTAGNRVIKLEAETAAGRRNLLRDSAQAGAELEAARGFQRADDDIFSRYEVVESGVDADLAEEKKEYAQRMLQIRQRLAAADRDLLSIEQRKASLTIDQAESSMRALEITAPLDGIFILQRDWRGDIPRVGSSIWSGRPFAELARAGDMKAEAFVLEADSGGIAPGQTARVTIHSQPGRHWEATVERVDKVAKPRYRGVPVQYFGVTLKLKESDQVTLKPGTRIRATIETARDSDAVIIPREAIFQKNGKRIVYLAASSGFEPREVETGLISSGRVVVRKGLSGGETIALADPTVHRTRQRTGEGVEEGP